MTVVEISCASWSELISHAENQAGFAQSKNETMWYRGTSRPDLRLLPTLMRDTSGLSSEEHDKFEQDTFFEFQARAVELRKLNLNDWEYLFYGRHYGLPTRVLDWTDTLGVALYFALEHWQHDRNEFPPTIWTINPYDLNAQTWGVRDIILPRYLGLADDRYRDYGELLLGVGDWTWTGPVAIYPIQINERVRAQRGWFTIHGNDRRALDTQFPGLCTKLLLSHQCVQEAMSFLKIAGFNRFSIYPDLENLTRWIRDERLSLARNQKILP